MPTVAPLQGNFNGGEISPLLYGRVDQDRYKSSLALCKNWIPTLQGGLPRRPGTYYVNTSKIAGAPVKLIPFVYSTTQAYMLEFGFHYIRFYTNYGFLETSPGSGVPYEVVTPFLGSSFIKQLRFTQSADVLYLVSPNYPPYKLQRFGATNWVLTQIDFQDGPYLPENNTILSLNAAATTGSGVSLTSGPSQAVSNCQNDGTGAIKVTDTGHGLTTGSRVEIHGVTGTTEANNVWTITVVDKDNFTLQGSAFVNAYVAGGTVEQAVFDSHDVGRSVRLHFGSTWGWGKIASITNTYTATFDIKSALGGTGAMTRFRLGLWHGTTGLTVGAVPRSWPSCVGFHEDRLCFSGSQAVPQRIDGSNSGDYENFAPTAVDGTVADNNSLNFSLNSSDVNANQWLVSEEKGLLSGATSAEWILRPSINQEAITPTNVNAKRSTKWGSNNIQAIQIGKGTVFNQRGGRKIRELMYFFDIDGYRATDLTELAEHITGAGITDMAYQAIPYPILWCARQDGALLGMSYDRDVSNLRVAWHQHALGGQSDVAGNIPIIESMAVIPSPDGTHDDLWLSVKRYIGGNTIRTIEYMTKIFEDIDLQRDAFFVDCGLKYDAPIDISSITNANPANVNTLTAHGLSTGNSVRIDGALSELNGLSFTITVIDAFNFTLDGINSTTYSTNFTSITPQVRHLVTTISGLGFLNGETVTVYADGIQQSNKAVSGGAITLDAAAGTVSIGYGYNSDGKCLPLEAGAQDGTALAKTRRTHRMGMLLHRSIGLKIGYDFTTMDDVICEDGSIPAGTLYSGITTQNVEAPYDFENQFCFRVSGPYPTTILAIAPQMQTQDRR